MSMLRAALISLSLLLMTPSALADGEDGYAINQDAAIDALPGWMRRHADMRDGQRVAARSLRDTVRETPGFEKAFIRSVRIRKPAPTATGFLYEIEVRFLDRERATLRIDPSTQTVIKAPPGFAGEPAPAAPASTPTVGSFKKLPGWMRRHADREDGTRVAARSLKGVIRSDPRFGKASITSVFVRRPAPTEVGFMYEVWVRVAREAETIVYIDPVTRRILYEVSGGEGKRETP